MANRDVFPTANWRWPTGKERPTFEPIEGPNTYAATEALRRESVAADGANFDAAVAKCIRDRDELVAAVEAVLFHHQPRCLCALDFVCAACEARALLARIKAGS